jgi:hypothetical protein
MRHIALARRNLGSRPRTRWHQRLSVLSTGRSDYRMSLIERRHTIGTIQANGTYVRITMATPLRACSVELEGGGDG